MKDLNSCSLFLNTKAIKQKGDINDERNGYTSFFFSGKHSVIYTGGEKLQFPWIDGYHYLQKTATKIHTMFDLSIKQYSFLSGRKIKAEKCVTLCQTKV